MNPYLSTPDFAALFDEALAQQAAALAIIPAAPTPCSKCKGSGKFIAHTGRVVGKCFTCDGKGFIEAKSSAPATSITVEKIEASFKAARSNGIKCPKLRLDAFTFSRAPDTGRNAGSIYVKRGETYLGKVTDGQFRPTSDCNMETTVRVVLAASNPSKSAVAYGLRTGECSCCGRTLTNKLSIDLGIGPICRDKFGW